jgi:hypothetical protein
MGLLILVSTFQSDHLKALLLSVEETGSNDLAIAM